MISQNNHEIDKHEPNGNLKKVKNDQEDNQIRDRPAGDGMMILRNENAPMVDLKAQMQREKREEQNQKKAAEAKKKEAALHKSFQQKMGD